MKAVKRFKNLILKKRPELLESILGRGSRIVHPPLSIKSSTAAHIHKARSVDLYDRRPVERVLATEGVHHTISVSDDLQRLPERMDSCVLETVDTLPRTSPVSKGSSKEQPTSEGLTLQKMESKTHHPHSEKKATNVHERTFSNGKGHAHDPLTDTLYLDIGTGIDDMPPSEHGLHVVSESPAAADMNVYEKAYREEMERILRARGRAATLYLTRRVEHQKELREHENIVDYSREHAGSVGSGFSRVVAKAKEKARAREGETGHDAADTREQTLGKGEDKAFAGAGQGNVLAKIKGFEEKAAATSGHEAS